MAVEYQVAWRPLGSGIWTTSAWQAGLSLTINTAAFAAGSYEVQVTARDLAAGSASLPSAARQFTVSHGVVYDLEYRALGAVTWLSLATGVSGLQFLWATAGLPNGDYELKVKGRDTTGSTQSQFSAVRQFTVFHPPSGGGGPAVPNSVTLTDPPSIAVFGRRFMQVVLDASSNIDSQGEATTMAQAALDDLSLPVALQEIDTLYFWAVQLGDLHRFLPNGIHYDQQQDWYITRIQHVLDMEDDLSTIAGRATPSGSHLDWLRRQAGPGGSGTTTPAAGSGPTLTVTPFPTQDFYDIAWSGTGTIAVFKDGLPIATPANSFRVTRNEFPQVYEWQVTLNGQTISNTIVVPPYGIDVITPDLAVVPGALTTTTIPVAVSATNPQTGQLGYETPEMVPLVEMMLSGCTAVGFSGPGPHFLLHTGQTVTINRPSFAASPASAQFRAWVPIYGGVAGVETIVVTIPNQDKTSFGPSMQVSKGAETLDDTQIIWAVGAGTSIQYRIVDPFTGPGSWGAPPASPFNRSRIWSPVNAWAPIDTLEFEATKDGVTINSLIEIPYIEPPYIRNLRVLSLNPTTDVLTIGWEGLIEKGYAAVVGTYKIHLLTDTQGLFTPTTVTGLTTNSYAFNGLGFVPIGTAGAVITTARIAVEHFHNLFGTLVIAQIEVSGWAV